MSEILTDQQIPEKTSYLSVAYKWGLIASLVLIAENLFIYLMDTEGYHPQKGGMTAGLFNLAFSLLVFYLANKEYRDKYNGGYLTFGRGYGLSFMTGLIIIVITTIFMFVYLNYIVDFDLMVSNLIDNTIKQLKERNLSEKEITAAVEKTKEFSTIGYMITFSSIFTLIFYAIASLISSALTKRNPAMV